MYIIDVCMCVWNYTRGKVLSVQFVQLSYPNSYHKSGFILMYHKPGGGGGGGVTPI